MVGVILNNSLIRKVFISYQHFKKPYALLMLPCKINYLKNGAFAALFKWKLHNKATFTSPFSWAVVPQNNTGNTADR